jgi:hypothetical protein
MNLKQARMLLQEVKWELSLHNSLTSHYNSDEIPGHLLRREKELKARIGSLEYVIGVKEKYRLLKIKLLVILTLMVGLITYLIF